MRLRSQCQIHRPNTSQLSYTHEPARLRHHFQQSRWKHFRHIKTRSSLHVRTHRLGKSQNHCHIRRQEKIVSPPKPPRSRKPRNKETRNFVKWPQRSSAGSTLKRLGSHPEKTEGLTVLVFLGFRWRGGPERSLSLSFLPLLDWVSDPWLVLSSLLVFFHPFLSFLCLLSLVPVILANELWSG